MPYFLCLLCLPDGRGIGYLDQGCPIASLRPFLSCPSVATPLSALPDFMMLGAQEGISLPNVS